MGGAPNLANYDSVIVAFSGGKDSLACVLELLDAGVDHRRIELWHHDVDGQEGSTLMDWPVTRAYCRAVARELKVDLFFSWKKGGFEGEMLRDGRATGPTRFEVLNPVTGDVHTRTVGGDGPPGTRLRFPQVSADLSVRWCSSYLKIDVGAAALRNQARFDGRRTLFVTGERAEESSSRAKYKPFEAHRCDLRHGKKKRHVDAWRPVHSWTEAQVWERIRVHGIVPHPAYYLGWGRVSCAACIFGNKDQWASLREVNPAQFTKVAEYELASKSTIQRKLSVQQLADAGTVYAAAKNAELQKLATGTTYDQPVRVAASDWVMPAGAFGDSCGPT